MRKIVKDVSLVSQIDWARLAAFLDGEGHITIARQTSSFRIGRSQNLCQHVSHVSVSNTDPRLPLWIMETFGGSVTLQQKRLKNPNWKDISHWRVTGKNAAIVLKGCREFLLLKRDQADVVISFQSLIDSGENRGRKLSQENWNEREVLRNKVISMTARGNRKEAVSA